LYERCKTASRLWQGERLDFHRYSGRQKTEITLEGVAGSIDLPEGPGELWPLFAAGMWLHVGKGTTMGLGQVTIQPLDRRGRIALA
jgi:hypothetical protein